jgi:hypothetical protein
VVVPWRCQESQRTEDGRERIVDDKQDLSVRYMLVLPVPVQYKYRLGGCNGGQRPAVCCSEIDLPCALLLCVVSYPARRTGLIDQYERFNFAKGLLVYYLIPARDDYSSTT